MSAVEILIEITASAAVTLRGSLTGVVLDDGRSFSDFDVVDLQSEQRLGRFETVDDPATTFFEADYDKIRAFDDTYSLAGKAVVISVGRGNRAADYVKPTTVGGGRGLVWIYRGHIPINWTPSLQVRTGTCRVDVKDALGFKSFPVLTDYITRAGYPRAFRHDIPFPILFGGSAGSPPGSIIFPMDRIDQETSGARRGTWSLGNLPLATSAPPGSVFGTPQPLEDVLSSPYDTGGLSGVKNEATAQFRQVTDGGRVYSANRVAWYIGTGIGATAARGLPGLAAGNLIENCGHVLYWLLRYKAGIPAAQLDHATIYGGDAPSQVASGTCYHMVRRPIEVASAVGQIGREVLAPLVAWDGYRLGGAGAVPRWTLADVYIDTEIYYGQHPAIDPGWLLTDERGVPLITPLAAHRLYANSVDIQWGAFPAVTNLPSQPYYLNSSAENTVDQAARGVKHLELAFEWNDDPTLLLRGNTGFGLAHGDRWGRWAGESGAPLTYQWAFRLPFGDVLVGDICNFGPWQQDPADDESRFVYVVEQTRLDWRAGLLECRGPRLWVGEA